MFLQQFRPPFPSALQPASPWNSNTSRPIKAKPHATLYHAMERNWLMSNCAKMAAAPAVERDRHFIDTSTTLAHLISG